MVEFTRQIGTPLVRNKPAPVVAFATFKKALLELRASGIPEKFEHAEFYLFSPYVQDQLMAAFRFADLVTSEDVPTDKLAKLVEAVNTVCWAPVLSNFLQATFAEMFKLDLAEIDREVFFARFAETYRGRGVGLRKAIAFFVHAAKEAQVPTHADFGKRRARTPRVAIPSGEEITTPAKAIASEGDKAKLVSPYDVLMYDIFDPATMPPGSEEERAVFTLARHIRVHKP